MHLLNQPYLAPPQAGPHPPDDPSLVAIFSFVSLAGGKACPVPPLAPSTDKERRWFQQRQGVADARKEQRASAAAAGGAIEGGCQRWAGGCHKHTLCVLFWRLRLWASRRDLRPEPEMGRWVALELLQRE